jgi:hypothetical protein
MEENDKDSSRELYLLELREKSIDEMLRNNLNVLRSQRESRKTMPDYDAFCATTKKLVC